MSGHEDSPCVLVIDDDPVVCDLAAHALGLLGYRVVTAAEGLVALQILTQLRPAVILLDLRMPVMTGWQFVEAYRQSRGPHAPIVVMTATTEARIRAEELEANGYLAKPIELERLVALVEQLASPPLV